MTQDLSMVKDGTSNVTINGKVISRGDVEVLDADEAVLQNSQFMVMSGKQGFGPEFFLVGDVFNHRPGDAHSVIS